MQGHLKDILHDDLISDERMCILSLWNDLWRLGCRDEFRYRTITGTHSAFANMLDAYQFDLDVDFMRILSKSGLGKRLSAAGATSLISRYPWKHWTNNPNLHVHHLYPLF